MDFRLWLFRADPLVSATHWKDLISLYPEHIFHTSINLQKKRMRPISSHLDAKSLVNKESIKKKSFWEIFSCRRHREVLSKHFPKEEIHVQSQHFSDHNEGEHILAIRVGIDAINYTIQLKIWKQNFPTVTKSSLMNLC